MQLVVPAGVWFGSSVDGDSPEHSPIAAELMPHRAGAGPAALVGCVVSPGFSFDGFELAERAALTAEFPQHAEVIAALTRR